MPGRPCPLRAFRGELETGAKAPVSYRTRAPAIWRLIHDGAAGSARLCVTRSEQILHFLLRLLWSSLSSLLLLTSPVGVTRVISLIKTILSGFSNIP